MQRRCDHFWSVLQIECMNSTCFQRCRLRPIWRLDNGRAVLVAYHVFRGGRNQFGKIPGAMGRCEFGLEIVIALAYQVYILGLSFDKACSVMNFFQHLNNCY